MVYTQLWTCVMVMISGIVILESRRLWGYTPIFPDYMIPETALVPKYNSVVRRKIVLQHNFFRSKVRPTAANMLVMSWHPIAAKQAQKYAEKCIFLKHNDPRENTVPNLGSCGQNLFVASRRTTWFFAIKSWFLEYQNFTYGSPKYDFHKIGHYTQMAWATSHKVGCGLAHCPGGPWGQFYNYVCHYCPGGNVEGIIQYPYKPGIPCSDCPKNCVSNKLCLNSCYKKDMYSNCNDLIKLPDTCRRGLCNATCSCKDSIYKEYPWK